MKLTLLTLVLATLLLGAASAHAQAEAEGGTELEEGAIKVELSGTAERDMFVMFAGDTLYLPFTRFCEFLKMLSSTSADGKVLKGEIPAGSPFTISRVTSIAEHDTISLRFDPSLVREAEGEVYVNSSLLADCLGLSMRFNYSSLRLVIDPDAKIPAVSLKQDRRKYSRLVASESLEAPEHIPDAPVRRQLLGSMTLAWALAGNYEQQQGAGTGSLQLGGPFLFGLLNVRGSARYQPQIPDVKPLVGAIDSWDWQIVFPNFPLLRRFSVSSMIWGGGLPPEYNLSISNERLTPLEDYSMHELTGHTQPGWTVEMYEYDQLVGVTQADSMGYYKFTVPASGSVQRTFASVGPHGERLLEERLLDFNPSLLPLGDVEYTVNATAQQLGLGTPVNLNGVLRAGVANWLSLGGRFSLVSSSLPNISRDSLVPSLDADLWLGGASSMGLRYNPLARAAWSELVTRLPGNLYVRANLDSLDIDDMTFRGRASVTSTFGSIFLGASGLYSKGAADHTIGVTPQISGSIFGISLSLNNRMEWSSRWGSGNGDVFDKPITSRTMISTAQMITPVTRWASLSVRESYDHLANRFGDLAVRATIRPFRSVGLNIGWNGSVYDRWQKGVVSASLTLNLGSFQARIGADRYEERVVYSGNSSTRGATRFSAAGIDYSDQASMGNAAIIVQGFWDRNGNGVQDDGETDLNNPGVSVRYGSASVRANDGRFLSIPIYRECSVEIDRASFIGDGLFPTVSQFDVYSLPSSVHVINVPFAEGFEVSGECSVEFPGGVRKVPGGVLNGLSLRLESTTGNISVDGEVFDDGSVLVSGVPAGEYRVILNDEQLAGRRIRLKGPTPTVKLDEDTTTLPTILFEPSLGSEPSIGK